MILEQRSIPAAVRSFHDTSLGNSRAVHLPVYFDSCIQHNFTLPSFCKRVRTPADLLTLAAVRPLNHKDIVFAVDLVSVSAFRFEINVLSTIRVLDNRLIQTAVFICNVAVRVFLQLSYMNRTGTCKHIDMRSVFLLVKEEGKIVIISVKL